MSAPMRFLATAILGWAAVRAWMLMPEAMVPTGEAAEAPSVAPTAEPPVATRWVLVMPRNYSSRAWAAPSARTGAGSSPIIFAASVQPIVGAGLPAPPIVPAAPRQSLPQTHRPEPAPLMRPTGLDRWSASAWLLVRGNPRSSLASAGTLGGSQGGFRIGYRLGRPLALSARVSSPLGNRRGAEAAFGLDWRPSARLPLNLLVERRQAIRQEGRNAFALTLYGGIYRRLAGNFRLDAYAQAGIVGAQSRDLFADGGVRLGVPIRGVEVGASVAGGVQPGVARLDLGPQVTLRVPVAGERLRLTAEWRIRIAGEARPGSGPALTLASDF